MMGMLAGRECQQIILRVVMASSVLLSTCQRTARFGGAGSRELLAWRIFGVAKVVNAGRTAAIVLCFQNFTNNLATLKILRRDWIILHYLIYQTVLHFQYQIHGRLMLQPITIDNSYSGFPLNNRWESLKIGSMINT